MFSRIQDVYDYIYSFINLEKGQKLNKKNKVVYSLDNINNILGFFNNPHKNKKIIHVTGTKGKGSVTLFITNLLRKLKYNTATFTSPHLLRLNERFLFNLTEIDDDELMEITINVKEVLEKNNLVPTTFELMFVVFLLFAQRKNADYLVIEVGLGGRLDTTNIVTPELSVITPVSFDHMKILGKTLSEIAEEKAGIIKEGIPVVASAQKKKAMEVVLKKCLSTNSKLYEISKYFKLLKISQNEKGIIFGFIFKEKKVDDFFLPLLGEHQINNFFTALLSVYILKPEILTVIDDEKRIDIKIPCRIEVVRKDPVMIVDVSHNKDSAIKLKKTLLAHFPEIEKWILLSAMSVDKDYKGFYSGLKEITELAIITSTNAFKSNEPDKVFEYAKKSIKNTLLMKNIDEAYDKALSYKKPLLITGSFYLASPVMEKLNRRISCS